VILFLPGRGRGIGLLLSTAGDIACGEETIGAGRDVQSWLEVFVFLKLRPLRADNLDDGFCNASKEAPFGATGVRAVLASLLFVEIPPAEAMTADSFPGKDV